MSEDDLLSDPLELTNRWYPVAKIAGHKLREAMHRQHADDMCTLMSTSLYGPGDDVDLEMSHVLPALLWKAREPIGATPGGADALVGLSGSGTPKREFLYVEDLADVVDLCLRRRRRRFEGWPGIEC